MARPTRAESIYRIPIRKNGGYIYASTHPYTSTAGGKDKFSFAHEMLGEMRSIRCIEHKGKTRVVTPFVGSQLEICLAFGFDLPQGCAPVYHSRKKEGKKRVGD